MWCSMIRASASISRQRSTGWAKSELLGRYIDPGYLQVYAEVKRGERARFLDHIARREYDWYL